MTWDGGGCGPGRGRKASRTCAVPEELCEHAVRTADAKEDGVVIVLREAVVLEEHARVRVDIRVRVLGLAMLGEHAGHHLVDGVDEPEGQAAAKRAALARPDDGPSAL